MNRFYKIISIILIISILMSIPVFGVDSFFLDVDKDNPYYDAVQYCYEQNYINGTGNNNFSPDKNITLTEFLSINLAAFYPEEYKNINFNDWYNSINSTSINLGLITEWESKNSQNNCSWIKIFEIIFKSNSLIPFSSSIWNVSFHSNEYIIPEVNLISSANQYGFLNNLNILNYKETPLREEVAQLFYNVLIQNNNYKSPEIVSNFPINFTEDAINLDIDIAYRSIVNIPETYLNDFVNNGWEFHVVKDINVANAVGLTSIINKKIYVELPMITTGAYIIYHEFGHFISYNYNIFLPLDIFEREKTQLSQFIRPYAATNIDEAFAELYAFYMTYNSDEQIMNNFKASLPLCYDFLVNNIILQ